MAKLNFGKIIGYSFYAILIYCARPVFSYENTLQDNDNIVSNNIENDNLIPEILRLRKEQIEAKIQMDDLFSLASFYLSIELYGKSAEIYGLYIDKTYQEDISDTVLLKRSQARFNRGLALFSQSNYRSSSEEFEQAYLDNPTLKNSLRMAGSASFLDKNINASIRYWEQYLNETTESSPERAAVEKALSIIKNPRFLERLKQNEESSESIEIEKGLWNFLNPNNIPNPDSDFQKKRMI